MVHLAPALVGPSDPGVVRAGRQGVCRRDRGRGGLARARLLHRDRRDQRCAGAQHGDASRQARAVPHPRRGRARHLVLLGAVAVLDARLAGRDAGAEALLSDQRAGHRLRHHLLLGRPHDDDGPALHEGGAVPRRLHPPSRPRREGRQDVEVEGQRRRPARHHRRLRRRRAALHAGARAAQGHDIRLSPQTRRGLPQFRDQALERRALRRVQRRRPRRGLRSEVARRRRSTAGSRTRPRRPRARSPRRSRPTSSTRRPTRPIASSGTSIATGMWNWRSRC